MRRLLSLLAILTGVTTATWAVGWEAQTLSTGSDYRYHEKGAFDVLRDDSGNTHLVYGGNALYYKIFNGTGWSTTEKIDQPVGTSYFVGYDLVRITLDGNSKLHILHNRGDKLRYTTNASGAWKSVLLDTGVVGVSDIKTDDSGFVHFIYSNSSGNWYVSDKSGGLAKEKVSDNAILNFTQDFYLSLESGEPELFFCQYGSSLARFSKESEEEWVTRTYLYEDCDDFDLALDSEGLWHLALAKNSQVPNYAYEKTRDQWEREDIHLLLGDAVDHGPIVKESSVNIVLDASDKAYISLIDDWDEDNLTLLSRNINEFEPLEANWSSAALPFRYVKPWHRMIMGTTGPELFFTDYDAALRHYRPSDGAGTILGTRSYYGNEFSLRIDTGGNRHATWLKDDTLYYGTDAGGSWSETVVATAQNYPSPVLEVSGSGKVFIKYRDPDYVTTIIHSTDTNWSIDSGFNDACGNGLVLERNSSGVVHVACAQGGTVRFGYFDETSDTWSDPGETVGTYSGTVDGLDLAFYDNDPFILLRIDASDTNDNKTLYLLHRENGNWEGNTSFREYTGDATGPLLASGTAGLHLLYGIPAQSFENYYADGEFAGYGMMEYGSWNPTSGTVTTEPFPAADTPAIVKSAVADDEGKLFVTAQTGIITDGKFANYQSSLLIRRNGAWAQSPQSDSYTVQSNLDLHDTTLFRMARGYYRGDLVLLSHDTDMTLLAERGNMAPVFVPYAQTSSEQKVGFVNLSESAVSLNAATLSGSDAFSIKSDGCVGSLPAGDRCEVSVIFAPDSGNGHSAVISVSTEGGTTEKVNLTGYAVSLADPQESTPSDGSGDGDDDEGCFIATAAYGTVMHADIDVLRHFRDSVLMQNSIGRWLVQQYYAHSPAVADWIREASWRQTATRGVLKPIIWGLTHPWGALAGLLALLSGIWWIRGLRKVG